MTLYPENLTKNDRFYDFEVLEQLFSDANYSVFKLRNLNTEMHLCMEIPHTEQGGQYLDFKKNIITELGKCPFFRHLVQPNYTFSYPNILMVELLPPVSMQKMIKNNSKLSNRKLSDVVHQLLSAIEYFYNTFGTFPYIGLDNIYWVGSRIVIDYVNSDSNIDFIHNFAEIILRISDDTDLAERIVKLIPRNFPDFDFNFLKANLIALFGSKFNSKIRKDDDFVVKCPICTKEYFISACVCRQCNVNLITGELINETLNQRKTKKKGRDFTFVALLGAFLGIFLVFSKALGFGWLLWTILSSIAIALLVVVFIFIIF